VPKQLTSRIDLGGRVEVTEKPLLDFDSKRGYLVRVARISLTMRPAQILKGETISTDSQFDLILYNFR
jgi:hypothetical protein